ncbi:hypothetical protein BpHYR1_016543 [Brachionus plicatilis]|uniref:Uncharacterized protein n=1 Tax=Brachionus plicatilis TaxID=10195 RepID=A0A3M7PT57_BRAPC|nr:hypothetical protein BpHYR1_016543 [Brachionus plicatilis]
MIKSVFYKIFFEIQTLVKYFENREDIITSFKNHYCSINRSLDVLTLLKKIYSIVIAINLS